MPDAPDYSRYDHIATFVPSTDVNELAAKLSSPSTMSREGQIVYQTDWRNATLGWSVFANPGDAEIFLVNTPTAISGYSLELRTTVTDEDYCYIEKEHNIFDSNKYILTSLFALNAFNCEFFVYLYVYQNGYFYDAELKFKGFPAQLYYYNSVGTWTEVIPSPSWYVNQATNILMHLCIDVSTEKYVSLYLNNHLVDLSNISLRKSATGNLDSLYTGFYFKAVGGLFANMWINTINIAVKD
jgi:hypothetical protein